MAKGSRIESKNDGANTKINRNTRLRVGSGITEKGCLSTCGQCIQCIHLLEGNMSRAGNCQRTMSFSADPPNITFKLLRAATSEEGNKDLKLGRGNTKGRSSGRGSKRVQTATMQVRPSRRVRFLQRVCVCVKASLCANLCVRARTHNYPGKRPQTARSWDSKWKGGKDLKSAVAAS